MSLHVVLVLGDEEVQSLGRGVGDRKG
ncbi:MAG: hypothetical protein JWP34_4847, partial [Massilia sp.]|nr:hypothetical protein [Massilia sp.]